MAGAQEGDDVQLALAYGMTGAGDRRLVLALPHEHRTATRQRLPWFAEAHRPELWLHNASGVEQVADLRRATAVGSVAERLGTISPREEFTAAATALHLGPQAGSIADLVDWATRDDRLDAAHRQNERSWHCMGQRVLSVRRTRGALRVLAGVHGSTDDRAPLEFHIECVDGMTEEQFGRVQEAVEDAVARRLTPGDPFLHRPDEHWLQAVIRRWPSLVGIEQPALREVPAWRPRDTPSRWSRGYVDLMGLDGHGDVRLVETKLATNDDALFVLQALDYLTWAHAYREALLDRLGASREARLSLHLVVGANEEGQIALSRYSRALLDALEDDVDWSVQAVQDWFGPTAEPRPTVPPARTLPVEWDEAARRDTNPFRDACRKAAARWKARSATLPEAARQAAPWWGGDPTRAYPSCLPAEFSTYNLLPDVREEALALFAEVGIPWHRGRGAAPGNHLLSSQVQCVNALARMVRDGERLSKAFGSTLDIAEVLPVEEDGLLTFEFIGSADVLGEGRGGRRTRGAQNTSGDAAFRYRTSSGTVELALVEWKYTEEYRRGRPTNLAGDVIRRQRYLPYGRRKTDRCGRTSSRSRTCWPSRSTSSCASSCSPTSWRRSASSTPTSSGSCTCCRPPTPRISRA